MTPGHGDRSRGGIGRRSRPRTGGVAMGRDAGASAGAEPRPADEQGQRLLGREPRLGRGGGAGRQQRAERAGSRSGRSSARGGRCHRRHRRCLAASRVRSRSRSQRLCREPTCARTRSFSVILCTVETCPLCQLQGVGHTPSGGTKQQGLVPSGSGAGVKPDFGARVLPGGHLPLSSPGGPPRPSVPTWRSSLSACLCPDVPFHKDPVTLG